MFGVSIRLQAKFHIGKKNKIRWILEFAARLDHTPLISDKNDVLQVTNTLLYKIKSNIKNLRQKLEVFDYIIMYFNTKLHYRPEFENTQFRFK